MQRNRFLLSLVVALFFTTLVWADSAPVNMTFVGVGGNNSGGYYTYPYYFSINGGQATALMCDSFSNHVSVGESWTANVTGLLSGKGLYGNQLLDYKAAGLIFMGVLSGKINANTGNWAVWNLFTSGITTDSTVLSLDQTEIALAKHTPASYFKGLVLYTPVGASPGHGPQEYIGYGKTLATPEPGTMMMLGTGLVGIAGLVRRKLVRG
ncbi:MAG: PEP-CTERM sorting domain-containing protein [Terriglobales bacterium]